MEKKLYELKIDPELRDFIPDPTESERQKLEDELIADGCIDPLIVWDGIIVDGHNRYAICHQYNIPFAIQEMDFDSKDKAKLWMAKHQLARRNLKPFQRCELIYPLEKAIKDEANERRKAAISSTKRKENIPPNSAESKDSRDILAEMADVSHGTWDMAIVIIKEGDEETKIQLRSDSMSINAAYKKLRPAKKKAKSELKETRNNKSDFDDDQYEKAQITYEPITHIDGSLEVPCARGEQERVPRPFPFVRDQVQFAVENMIREVQIGLNWLNDEDTGRIEELQAILDDGYKRAKDKIRTMEETS